MKKLFSIVVSLVICSSMMLTSGIFAFAEESKETYSVVFYEDSTKSKKVFERENIAAGTELVLTYEASKEGCEFVSWVDAQTGAVLEVVDDKFVVSPKNAEYYATWKANTYKLYYRGFNEVVAEYDVVYGTPSEQMPVPTEIPERDGYEFVGWESLPETMPAENYNVKAQWKEAEHLHNPKTIIIEPTCTENGKRYNVCEDCGETIGEITVIPLTGHKSSDWIIDIEPTVNAEGKKIKKCLTCGVTLNEEAIEKLEKPNKDGYSKAEINIRNNPVTATLNYGETLRIYVVAENMANGEHVEWSVTGNGVEIISVDGMACEVKSVSGGTAKLTATVVDAEGNPVTSASGESVSDSQFINSKAGIIQKIIAFFRNLFGINKIITQSVRAFI